MIPKNRLPVHPGEVLCEEFLKPMGVTQVELAAWICVPVQRINGIVRCRRGVSPETAWLLSQALGTTPQFWINLQTNYDLALSRPKRRVKRLVKPGV